MSDEGPRARDTLARWAVGMTILFLITLSVVVARRMTADALAVIAGVVCGVAAAVPTLVLLAYVLLRTDTLPWRRPAVREEPKAPKQMEYPPVVIVQSPYQPTAPSGYWPAPRTPALLDEGDSQDPNIRVVGVDD
jgi:hypothetical protein